MITLLRKGMWGLVFLLFLSTITKAQETYSWIGGPSGAWTTPTNWSPERATPQPDDVLEFSSGGVVLVTDVPTQTLGMLLVQSETDVSLQASGYRILTIRSVLQVDEESTLQMLNNGATIDVNINSGDPGVQATATVLGQVIMHRGSFQLMGNSWLTLNGESPLNRVQGQFVLSESTHLWFGSGDVSGSTITLPDNIFLGSQRIARMTVSNEGGVELGNQKITVTDRVQLFLGNIITNAEGRLELSSTAIIPNETLFSSIEGFLEVTKNVGTGAATFPGLDIEAGADDLGNVTVVRRTGTDGVNSFNGAHSIASTWSITAQNQPVSGRSLKFRWVQGYDNGNDGDNPSTRFQVYSYESGDPAWEAVGSLMTLEQNGEQRVTQAVTTTHFSDWTVADESQPLPVTWVDFFGRANHNGIALTWKTGTEENTDYFSVEKMAKDKTFFPIGQQPAAGNSRSVRTYTFEDGEPSPGLNYYRIRQVDLDNKFSYSTIIAVQFEREGVYPYTIFPIPAVDKLTVKRNQISMGEEVVRLVDQFGREVYSQYWPGDNPIVLETLGVPAGVYQLIIAGSGTQYTQRVIIR